MAPIISGKNLYERIFDTKIIKKIIPETPTDMAGTLALVSTITKDVVNCYYYTTQSLNNKKIPEEKRKFVAGLDLSNGILNVIVPGILGVLINNNSKSIFKKWFGKYFTEDAGKKLYGKMLKTKTQFTEKQVIEGLMNNRKYAEAGFKVMAVLIITQVVGKRIINPLLSTPMAGIFKEQMEKREKKAAQKCSDTEPKEIVDNKATLNQNADDQSDILQTSGSSFSKFYADVMKPVKFSKNA